MIFPVATPAEFNSALNLSMFGDTISIDRTKIITGEFTFKNKGVCPLGLEIIIESDTPTAMLPAPGYRMTPAYSPVLAKLQSTQLSQYQNEPVLRTEAGANGYVIRNLEILPSMFGSQAQVRLGYGFDVNYSQTEYSQIPYNFRFDRCYIHGHAISGQKVGISCHAYGVRIHNTWMDDYKGHGQDATPISGGNYAGLAPEIINCHLEGAGYIFILGGEDVIIRTVSTVLASPAPTTTQATVSTLKDLSINQRVSILTHGNTRRAHPKVTAIDVANSRITYEAIDVAPDVPGDIRWGATPSGLRFRRNHCLKPLSWRNPIIHPEPVLSNPQVVPAAVGVGAGTYFAVVLAIQDQQGYQNTTYYSRISNEIQFDVTQTSELRMSWTASPITTKYRVHIYQKSGTTRINAKYFETTGLTFAHINNAGTTYTNYPTPSKWNIKNLFELKNGNNSQIDSNIFENAWYMGAGSLAAWFKVNNQDLQHDFSETDGINFEWNEIRHTAGTFDLSTQRATGEQPQDYGKKPENWRFSNILVHDSSSSWIDPDQNISSYNIRMSGACDNLELDHVTFIHTNGSGAVLIDYNIPVNGYWNNMKWTNSIFIKGFYGFLGPGGEGKNSFGPMSNNTYDFNKNVVAGADTAPSPYTLSGKTNYTPDMATFANQFKNYDNGINGDYRLKRISEGDNIDSLYINAGTDGKDLGCDVAQLMNRLAGVVEGLPEGTVINPDPPPPPPPPPPAPGGTVLAKMVNFNLQATAGEQYVDVGFTPKAIMFFYSSADQDEVNSDWSMGMGCACDDGTKWAGFLIGQNGQTTARNSSYMKDTTAIGITNAFNSIYREVVNVAMESTGFRMTITVPVAGSLEAYKISALVLGGSGVQDSTAFMFQPRTSVGTQDVGIGFQPDGLIFYAPVNTTAGTPVPHNTSKNASTFLGFVSAVADQFCVVNRFPQNTTTIQARRIHRTGKAIATYADSGIMMDAAVSAFLSTGFRLDVTNTIAEANYVFGLGVKGPRFKATIFTEPVANGNQSYVQGFKPEAVILASDLYSSPDAFVDNARLAIGAGTSPTERSTTFAGYRHNNSPTISSQVLTGDKLLRGYTEGAPPAVGSSADIVSFTPTGYTLNWSGTPGTAEILSLAIGSSVTTGAELAATADLEFTAEANLDIFIILATVAEFFLDAFASLVTVQAIHHAIIQFFGLKVALDVKREVDSGQVDVLASDAAGTVVLFNKSFKSVDSITLSVESLTPVVPIYDFDGSIANPTSFKVLTFNQAGARVNATVSWKARGIV